MNKLKMVLAAPVASLAAFSAPTMAADWTATTGAIDYSGEITAIIAIVGVIATVVVTMKGGQWLISALKKG